MRPTSCRAQSHEVGIPQAQQGLDAPPHLTPWQEGQEQQHHLAQWGLKRQQKEAQNARRKDEGGAKENFH